AGKLDRAEEVLRRRLESWVHAPGKSEPPGSFLVVGDSDDRYPRTVAREQTRAVAIRGDHHNAHQAEGCREDCSTPGSSARELPLTSYPAHRPGLQRLLVLG